VIQLPCNARSNGLCERKKKVLDIDIRLDSNIYEIH